VGLKGTESPESSPARIRARRLGAPPSVPSRCSSPARAAALAVLLALSSSSLDATERLYRRFDHRNGLEASQVTAIGQDDRGFLWIGVIGELLRFDGSEFRSWSSELRDFAFLQWHPELGMLAKTNPDGGVWRVTSSGLERLLEGGVPPVGPVWWMSVGPDGSLWLLEESGVLHRRAPEGAWSAYGAKTFGDEQPTQVFGSISGGAWVGTADSLWRLAADGSAERALEAPGEKLAAEHPSGLLYVAVRGRAQLGEASRLVELRGGVARTVHTFSERPAGIGIRGDDVWFTSMETFRYRPGGAVERLDPRSDFSIPFSKIFVDREGSLWLGGYDGLVQLPDPDTVAFTAVDGLPGIPAFGDLARTDEGIWAGFFDGLGLIRRDSSGELRASTARRGLFAWDLCVDALHRVWTYSAPTASDSSRREAGILEIAGGEFRFHQVADNPRSAGPCAAGEDGRVWFLVEGRLYRTPAGSGAPEKIGEGPEGFKTAFTMQDGRLWVGYQGRLCSVVVDEAGMGRDAWACEEIPEAGWIYDVQKMPSGALWAATGNGIFRRAGGHWLPLTAAPHRIIHEIVASPSGGVWITSSGAALRIAERPDLPAGLEVLERLSMWQGTTSGNHRNIMEEDDGTLWITGPEGPIRMPRSARFAEKPVPEVALVDALVDGKRISAAGEIELPYSRNRIELKFAALTYRDPLLVRYRVRSNPSDEWIETAAPGFHFADLAPGRYQPQVIASLDGAHWTSEPASLSIRVLPPWYRTTWAMALFALAAALALYAAYRARVAVLLRLERQRSRIAMDLHDEIGSGLGSIGLLADLVARKSLAPDKQESIAGKIAATAEELGAKLRDILWSLRTPSPDLQGLASHLGESGGRLFPDSTPRFRTAFPESWPSTPLSLAVRRNLQLIALEAMHNAARHAGGSRVELGFDASERIWRMWVEDDGRGMPPETSSPGVEHGIGLEAMRSRAAQIGATILWTPGGSGGTRVEVAFRPSAADRRLRRRRE